MEILSLALLLTAFGLALYGLLGSGKLPDNWPYLSIIITIDAVAFVVCLMLMKISTPAVSAATGNAVSLDSVRAGVFAVIAIVSILGVARQLQTAGNNHGHDDHGHGGGHDDHHGHDAHAAHDDHGHGHDDHGHGAAHH